MSGGSLGCASDQPAQRPMVILFAFFLSDPLLVRCVSSRKGQSLYLVERPITASVCHQTSPMQCTQVEIYR